MPSTCDQDIVTRRSRRGHHMIREPSVRTSWPRRRQIAHIMQATTPMTARVTIAMGGCAAIPGRNEIASASTIPAAHTTARTNAIIPFTPEN